MQQLEEYRGLLVRPGVRLDEFAAEETTWRKFVNLLGPEDLLLDIGAYIGSVAKKAAERGATVVAYEPFPAHYEVLAENARGGLISAEKIAVMGEAGEVTLYLAPKSPMAHSTVKKKRTSGIIEVPAVSFESQLEKYRPTAVKVDVEGAEYTFLDLLQDPPSYVRKMAIEFHLIKDEEYLSQAQATINIWKAAGWEFVIGPRYGGAWKQLLYAAIVR